MNVTTKRRSEIVLEDVNFYDPDTSSAMFYGEYVRTYEREDQKASFLLRKVDPGTLLELTGTALIRAGVKKDHDPDPDPVSPIKQIENARVQLYHRLEILQKCIIKPQFDNLKQLEKIPMEWQIDMYQFVMHGILGGDAATVRKFRGAD